MGRYLNYDLIKANHNSSNPITVKCYFNGLYYACPDPKDKKTCQSVEQSYNQGIFITTSYYKISQDDYDNKSFWN